MRGAKSFLVLLVIAIAIGAYAYFVESKKEVSDASTTKTEKVWTMDADKVEEIEVKASNGDRTTLKKNGGTWQITAPKPADADQSAASSMASSLASLESTKTVDEKPASVKAFELDPPNVSVRVRLAGEKEFREVDLGTKTPTGTDLYARVQGQPKVFLVGSYLDGQLNRTTFDLRDKSVLKFDRTKVDSLELKPSGSPDVSLTKKSSEEWRLTTPVAAKADFSVVDGVLSKISQTQMKSIVEEGDAAATLKKYGLDAPQVQAIIGAGSTRATLALGGKAPDGNLYARDLTRPMVFEVEASLLDDLKKKPDDVRQKMLFEFRSYTALNLDVAHGAEAFSFAKSAGPAKDKEGVGADVWKADEAVGARRRSDQDDRLPRRSRQPESQQLHGSRGRRRRRIRLHRPVRGREVAPGRAGDAPQVRHDGARAPAGRTGRRGHSDGRLRQGDFRAEGRHRVQVTRSRGRGRPGFWALALGAIVLAGPLLAPGLRAPHAQAVASRSPI